MDLAFATGRIPAILSNFENRPRWSAMKNP